MQRIGYSKGRAQALPFYFETEGADQMTKAQIKQMQMAAGHLTANNPEAFLRCVSGIIRAARTQKQIDAIKEYAFDLQFPDPRGGK